MTAASAIPSPCARSQLRGMQAPREVARQRSELGPPLTRAATAPPIALPLPLQRTEGSAHPEALVAVLCRASSNPHRRCIFCDSTHVQRWGRRAGRQRYRCSDCRRTFTNVSGTPLDRCKRLDRWPAFCSAVLDSETVRAAAESSGIHATTSFRWRHALLSWLRAEAPSILSGVVAADEVRFLYNEKGSRTLDRVPYRRGERGLAAYRERIWVLLLRDHFGDTAGGVIGGRPASVQQLHTLLASPPHRVTDLVCTAGQASTYAIFCRSASIRHHITLHWSRTTSVEDRYRLDEVRATTRRLRTWLKRFRGVASKYLDNYMRWHQAVDAEPSPAD